jgi:hypothetical protein
MSQRKLGQADAVARGCPITCRLTSARQSNWLAFEEAKHKLKWYWKFNIALEACVWNQAAVSCGSQLYELNRGSRHIKQYRIQSEMFETMQWAT